MTYPPKNAEECMLQYLNPKITKSQYWKQLYDSGVDVSEIEQFLLETSGRDRKKFIDAFDMRFPFDSTFNTLRQVNLLWNIFGMEYRNVFYVTMPRILRIHELLKTK